jgi:hypothetical protein
MALYKTINKDEILNAMAELAVSNLPKEIDGDIEVSYNDDDGIDIVIILSTDKELN